MRTSTYIALTVLTVMVLAWFNLAVAFLFVGIWAFFTLNYYRA